MMPPIKRFIPLMGCLIFLLFMVLITLNTKGPLLIYNATNSLPIGLYLVDKEEIYEIDDIILIKPEKQVKKLIENRNLLPKDGYLMKPIAALSGDFVCAKKNQLWINNMHFGSIKKTDKNGQLLSVFQCERRNKEYCWYYNPK